jgi:elongation factor P
MGFNFMDGETFEQISLSEEAVGGAGSYIADGATVRLSMHEGKPIGIELPAAVELEVSHAEPGVKGDRVSGATKPVTLATGLVIQAPLFVDVGDVVKVDTRTGDYITRVT